MVYRVRLTNDTRDVSVHLAHIKPYHQRETPPAPQFEKLAELFSGEPIPLPELDHPDAAQPKIESYFVYRVKYHKRGPGRPAPTTTSTAQDFEDTALNPTSGIERTKYRNVTN